MAFITSLKPRRIALVALMNLVVLQIALARAQATDWWHSVVRLEQERDVNPRLSSLFNKLARARAIDPSFAAWLAGKHGASPDGVGLDAEVLLDLPRVPQPMTKDVYLSEIRQVADVVSALGGNVLNYYGEILVAYLPIPVLEALAQHPSVRLVREPVRPLPSQSTATSEGVAAINAPAWHRAGITGRDVSVGVIDVDFAGYQTLQATELPTTIATCPGLIARGGGHGTAVAEVIADVAPGAALVFATTTNLADFRDAVDCMIAHDVRVVNFSAGYGYDMGSLDGGGGVNELVSHFLSDNDLAGRVIWVNAAGNSARQHWGGRFTDKDGDSFHEFEVRGNPDCTHTAGNAVQFTPLLRPNELTVFLTWGDDWSRPTADYDLCVYETDPILFGLIAVETVPHCSRRVQGNLTAPWEKVSIQVEEGARYTIGVQKRSGPDRDLDVLAWMGEGELQCSTSPRSLAVPADHPDVLAVGASPVSDYGQAADYSSQGPTRDGRIKPDLAAPTEVTTRTYGRAVRVFDLFLNGFAGTSAAAPHVAGAAALVFQQRPLFTRSDVATFLEKSSAPAGEPGKDNVFGSGLLRLPAPPPAECIPTSPFLEEPGCSDSAACCDPDATCDDGFCCKPVGASCEVFDECCYSTTRFACDLDAGRCVACLADGKPCFTDESCCTGGCGSFGCGSCLVNGWSCSANAPCCSGTCDGFACCEADLGQVCGADADCCGSSTRCFDGACYVRPGGDCTSDNECDPDHFCDFRNFGTCQHRCNLATGCDGSCCLEEGDCCSGFSCDTANGVCKSGGGDGDG